MRTDLEEAKFQFRKKLRRKLHAHSADCVSGLPIPKAVARTDRILDWIAVEVDKVLMKKAGRVNINHFNSDIPKRLRKKIIKKWGNI